MATAVRLSPRSILPETFRSVKFLANFILMTKADEVTRILQEWSQSRPDLDFSPLAVFSRLHRVAKQLNRARGAAFEDAGLELWEFDVLAVLRRAGAPHRVSTKVLVSETMVTSGTMTNRIDRMVRRGLVVRTQNPDDGRGVLVEMTATGRDLVDRAVENLTAAEAALLSGMTRAERDRLATLLTKLSVVVSANE